MSDQALHIFHDDCEWVIAHSAEDAIAVWCEFTGEDPANYKDDAERWGQLSDDAITPMWCGDDGLPGDLEEGDLVKEPNSYWIAKLGRSYMGSTES